MFNTLTTLGWGVVSFAIVIGVGVVVLGKFGGAIAECPATTAWNSTANACSNSTGSVDPTNDGWVATDYLVTQLGTTGLAGWAPAIIAFAVGMLFIGAFLIKKGENRSY